MRRPVRRPGTRQPTPVGFERFNPWWAAAQGRGGRADIDPALIVTHNGEPITHNGIVVTVGTNIDPALIVMNESSIVTESGRIITNGA